MPRILAAKASSLDDAARAIPYMLVDWVVEQSFSKVPGCASQLIRRYQCLPDDVISILSVSGGLESGPNLKSKSINLIPVLQES